MLRDYCQDRGDEKAYEQEDARTRDLTAMVQSKYSDAMLSLLVNLAHAGRRKVRNELYQLEAVAGALSFVRLYHGDDPVDFWMPCVFQALSLLECLSSMTMARQQIRSMIAEDETLIKAIVAMKNGHIR